MFRRVSGRPATRTHHRDARHCRYQQVWSHLVPFDRDDDLVERFGIFSFHFTGDVGHMSRG
ncbi:DUF6196 family protein [Nocardia coubleae]|uniref:DUF6196 family protein n=1 Tax=Nocardia coubleae TaxID=356147 RepID=UPI0035E3E633